MSGIEVSIVKNLDIFIAFARKRLGDRQTAEDIVQESLVKALAADRKPVHAEDTIAWFYKILRRSIIDLYRRNHARSRALERFKAELSEAPTAQEQRLLCQCFQRLLPSIPESYRNLLQQIDLEGKDPAAVATALGVTKNNLTVRLHRARKHLREMLSRNCQACSKHGCLDCTCGAPAARGHSH